MVVTSEAEFQQLIDQALSSIVSVHAKRVANVAFLYEIEPTREQREKLQLRNDQTLFGLYEGVPLSQRQGLTHLLPDKITLFKGPLERASNDYAALSERVRHTLWHEIGHYYGLDHKRIAELES